MSGKHGSLEVENSETGTIGAALAGILANVTIETDSSELATVQSNVPRLNNAAMQELQTIANAPLPSPPPCDDATFAKSMRAMSLLPSKADDDVKGELRLAIYQRMMGHYPTDAIRYLAERTLTELNWFPSPKQCLDILADWRPPQSEEARKRDLAISMIEGERRARYDDMMGALERRELDAEEIAKLSDRVKAIGVEKGYLRFDPETGYTVRPARPLE